MPLCGPKLSLFGAVLSVWGIVQLTLMGVFFYTNSVALVEDLPLKDHYDSEEAFVTDMNIQYHQSAINCWIAALLYLVTFCVSVQQFWMNNRSTYSV
ncbi:ribonuclease kappa [Lepeophtheirus salmonis]|uniref:Ribonuclease kappa n=1 Tax=Lepeophtheirus salmonis TaxID=72036 RepID=D3PFQ2_LEPSM|nr:ribonuclease kappa-like [Lepeophtheirus salmonis]ADD24098.1 Ribonuclease kappa [Lepeophtheirus salmonis]ADD38258.1 Ribonuclease kappa [Lepeophtheirus salmonis]